MLKRLRDELSERTKLFIYLGITVAVFITSCLLPLAFKNSSIGEDNYFDTGERAAMFVQYQAKSKIISSKIIDKPSAADVKRCDAIMDKIIASYRIDSKSGKAMSEGSEYVVVSDGENSMQLCRMWLQDEGDWTNWMDVYVDVDTGFIYYLYVSSICLTNGNDYLSALSEDFNSRTVANMIASETGFALKHFSWTGKVEDSAFAVTSSNGDTVCWNINCTYYPSTMLDVRISVA